MVHRQCFGPKIRLPEMRTPKSCRGQNKASVVKGLDIPIVPHPDEGSVKKRVLFMKTTISKIRTMRKRKGWTQAQLAEKSGVSANYIALLERGDRTPSLKLLSRIADALEVKVSSIFENDLQKDLQELKKQYNTKELRDAILHFADSLK